MGDDVFGIVNFPGHGRAYAQYVAAPAAHLAPKPAAISHQEAAAATLAALTAWQALVTTANVQPGQRVLVHAAAGGVGHFAVQLPGGPKLVAVDLATNQVARVIPLDKVLRAASFVDAVRFEGNTIYLTDAGEPALVVLDKATGEGRRVLERDASTTAGRCTPRAGHCPHPLASPRWCTSTSSTSTSYPLARSPFAADRPLPGQPYNHARSPLPASRMREAGSGLLAWL